MNADEFKKKYGDRTFTPATNFWKVGSLAPIPAIPTRLHKLLDETVKRLNGIYIPNAWLWVKFKNPDTWKELLEIEESINVAIEIENEGYLREALEKYYEIWVVIIEAFRPIEDKYVPF